jgi:hypothetical protein
MLKANTIKGKETPKSGDLKKDKKAPVEKPAIEKPKTLRKESHHSGSFINDEPVSG